MHIHACFSFLAPLNTPEKLKQSLTLIAFDEARQTEPDNAVQQISKGIPLYSLILSAKYHIIFTILYRFVVP